MGDFLFYNQAIGFSFRIMDLLLGLSSQQSFYLCFQKRRIVWMARSVVILVGDRDAYLLKAGKRAFPDFFGPACCKRDSMSKFF